MIGRQRPDSGQPLGDGIGNVAGVPAGPDPRAVDAAPAAVNENALHHYVQVLLPPIHLVVAEEDRGEPGAVRLDTRVAHVSLDGCASTEDEAAAAMLEHGRADVRLSRIDRNRLTRHARLEKRRRHAIWGPRFLGT